MLKPDTERFFNNLNNLAHTHRPDISVTVVLSHRKSALHTSLSFHIMSDQLNVPQVGSSQAVETSQRDAAELQLLQ